MTEIDVAVQKVLIRDRIKLWRNSVYQAGLDMKVATVLEDEQMQVNAKREVARGITAIDTLEKILGTL